VSPTRAANSRVSGAAAAKRARTAANLALGVWVVVALAAAIATGWSLYVLWLVVGTVVVYTLFAFDKRQARKGDWRVSERALLGSIVGGGVLGGWLGMLTLRHKTRHNVFWATVGASFVLHAGLVWMLVIG